ncbi:hypothetical protein IWW57_006256, partial [Coemansia sp. S610]
YADPNAAQYAAYNNQVMMMQQQQLQQQQQQQLQYQQQQQQQPMMPMPQHFGHVQQAYSNLGSQTVFSQPGMQSNSATGSVHQSQAQLGAAVPDGHFVFKLKTPSGKTHRFTAPSNDLESVRVICVKKLMSEGVRDAQAIIDESGLAYVDDEDDFVHITGVSDLADAIDLAIRDGKGRVMLQINPRALVHQAEQDKEDAIAAKQAQSQKKDADVLGPLGIPEKFLVPTAIGGGFVTALFCVWLAMKLSKN